MATYRDAALAEYSNRKAAWIKRGQEKLRPLMTDSTGKLVLDPLTKTKVVHEDQDAGLVVLETTDGSLVDFAVWPDQDQAVRVVRLVDEVWTLGPEVLDLDDVGAALSDEAARL